MRLTLTGMSVEQTDVMQFPFRVSDSLPPAWLGCMRQRANLGAAKEIRHFREAHDALGHFLAVAEA